MRFDTYFEKIEYYRTKGKGISVFNSSSGIFEDFRTQLTQSNISHIAILVSQLQRTGDFSNIENSTFKHLVLFQDLEITELKLVAEDLVNRIVFPTYYRNIPVSFFSVLDRTAYSEIQIESSLIHHDYAKVIRLLCIEQIDSLLSQVNFTFSTPPDTFSSSENIPYTPIELMLKEQFEEENISFDPQARVGRFHVDFIVESGGKQLIVECDGKDYHNPHRDRERDKKIEALGMKVLRLTGSEIYHDVKDCVKRVREGLLQIQQAEAKKIIDENLDDSQKAAIECITGPIRVLAPAGSGKTKALINRIVHLINSGVSENQILALAFNKKAKAEMAARLSEKHVHVSTRLSDDGVAVRTFHSFGYEIIRDCLKWTFDGERETKQTRRLMEQAFSPYRASLDVPGWKIPDVIDKMLEALRRTKMELPPLEEVTVEIEDKVLPFQSIFDKYIGLQNRHSFLNFDDMIYLSLRILLKNKIRRRVLQSRFRYILVDEFQDLNEAQLLTMQILALPNNNLYIVGDDDQMIYGWQGATITHILDFPHRYSESQDFTLSTNYRCTKKIVRHSSWLIEHNKNRVLKNIEFGPDSKSGILDVKLSENLYEQAVDVADWIEEQRETQKSNWKDFAVLFRYREYQFPLAMVLDSREIPHSPIDSQKLFSKNPGRDIYAYLTVILHPHDAKPEDYARILKRPNKYFTNDLISKARDWDSFIALDDPKLAEWMREKIQDFTVQIRGLQSKMGNPLDKPAKLVSAIVEEFNLRKYYKDKAKLAANIDDAGDNTIIEVIISVASAFEDINELYAHVYKSANDEYSTSIETGEPDSNEVLLDTIHSCKGKEFKNVIYFNLSNDGRSQTKTELEEERRVCYVGVTRAIKNFMITAPPKGRYSQFLPELLQNPAFRKLSIIELNNRLAQARMGEELLLDERKGLEEDIEGVLNLYPELKGVDLKVGSRFFKRTLIKLRLKRIEKAKNKIGKLQQKAENLTKELNVCREEIDEIETEAQFRQLLQDTLNEIKPA